jgi:AraC family transcriptional activator of pobA
MAEEIPGVNMADLRLKGFKVHELPAFVDVPATRGRRDFYKMGLVTGEMTIGYGDQVLELKDTVLFFVNPNVPRSVVRRSSGTAGYACIFTETFMPAIVKKTPLFQAGDDPVIRLNSEQAVFMTGLFQKMLTVHDGDYLYKGELIRSCIELIIHEALRIQPSPNLHTEQNAAARITHLFTDLLERQFPIERSSDPLRLRAAQDYAAQLNVHINYLNRSVKQMTGKPTSAHIALRIAAEAKALLQHTDWSIADIAYALGFEYPTYFNNYFKRVTGATPMSFRRKV